MTMWSLVSIGVTVISGMEQTTCISGRDGTTIGTSGGADC
jgi:hypothetical protein